MNILEQDIENVVWNAMASNPEELTKRGFPYDKRFTYLRQYEIGNYGRADIIGFRVKEREAGCYRIIQVSIIELKKDQVNVGTFLQAARYAKGLHHLLRNDGVDAMIEYQLHLIGKSIDSKGDFCYLPDIFDNVSTYSYRLDLINGLTFHPECNYELTDHGYDGPDHGIKELLKHNLKKTIQTRWAREKYYLETYGSTDGPF